MTKETMVHFFFSHFFTQENYCTAEFFANFTYVNVNVMLPGERRGRADPDSAPANPGSNPTQSDTSW